MFDPKEEQQFAELKKLARKLHVPIPEVLLTLEVFDKDGKLIQRHRQRSHSWVRNAYNQMVSQLAGVNANDDTFGAGKLNVKQQDETVVYSARAINICAQTSDPETVTQGYRGTAAYEGWGIIVGSGTNAESFEDFALQTPIAHGTGAGELVYPDGEAPAKSYADTTYKVDHVRYFNNNTAGETSVDVNEVALVTSGYLAAGKIWMNARDKLASTVTVPSTGQLKVTYTVQLTYPA